MDEHFQILEFASYKLGHSPASDLPWEFAEKMRPALQPAMAYIVCRMMDGLHATPFAEAFALRLFTSITALVVSLLLCVLAHRWLSSGLAKKTLFLVTCFFWFFPYYHCRFSSENYAGLAFFAAVAILLWTPLSAAAGDASGRGRPLRFLAAGFLMGLAFFFRFQMAFAVAGLWLWLVIFKKATLREFVFLAAAFCAACCVNIGIDRWFYGSWALTPVNYFDVNILKGVSGRDFGVTPWWQYFYFMIVNLMPPLSLLVVIALFVTVYKCPRNPLVWASVPFFLAHCAIGHKEFRFLFPLMYALPALLVLGADSLGPVIAARCRGRAAARVIKACLVFLVVANTILLVAYSLKPAKELMPVYKWIYKTGASRSFSLLSLKESPYDFGTKPLHFYASHAVSIVHAIGADTLVEMIRESKEPAIVALKGFRLPRSLENDSLEWKPQCRGIPAWLSHFDINHWLSRVRVWTVYAVREKNR
jgi:phosphatidylinositol glycan class B